MRTGMRMGMGMGMENVKTPLRDIQLKKISQIGL